MQWGAIYMVVFDGTESSAQLVSAPHPAALAGGRVKNKSTLRVSSAASWDFPPWREGTVMEKVIKLWKDECLPRGPKCPQNLPPSFCFRGGPQTVLAWFRWDEGHLDPNTPQPGCSNIEDPYLILAWIENSSFSATGMEHPLSDPQGRNQVQAGIPSFLDGGISQAQFNPSFIQTSTRVCALKEVKEDRDRHNWLLCVFF